MHVGPFCIGVPRCISGANGVLDYVPVFLDMQIDIGVDDMLEVFLNCPTFSAAVSAQGLGNFYLLTAYPNCMCIFRID